MTEPKNKNLIAEARDVARMLRELVSDGVTITDPSTNKPHSMSGILERLCDALTAEQADAEQFRAWKEAGTVWTKQRDEARVAHGEDPLLVAELAEVREALHTSEPLPTLRLDTLTRLERKLRELQNALDEARIDRNTARVAAVHARDDFNRAMREQHDRAQALKEWEANQRAQESQ